MSNEYDFPCGRCPNEYLCTKTDKCKSWKDWFEEAWTGIQQARDKMREELQAHD